MKNWQEIWRAHRDVFVANNWQECPNDKRKDWRLPAQFSYFSGGETALRVGIVASETLPKEDEFLLAGMLWANRLSNGARTVIYFIAPDFSPFLLQALYKIGGSIVPRAVYWRERLSPSLYLIPENTLHNSIKYSLGEQRLDWVKWKQELNPVAKQQLEVVKKFFDELKDKRVRTEIKVQSICFMWGNFEIAELRRKGKKFDLTSKAKWEKDPEKARLFQRQGWVDAAGMLNSEFSSSILSIIATLEDKEKKGELKIREHLSLCLHQGEGILSTLWGVPWDWPWVPKDRAENWIHDLGQWFYFQGNGQLSVVCPILEKPLYVASQSILLKCVLEKSHLLSGKIKPMNSLWDSRIHWLTLSSMESDLRLWLSWLKSPDEFQIWILPEHWQREGLREIVCRSIPSSFIET